MNKDQITEVVRQAFYEFMITGKAGVSIPKKAFPSYWEIFLKSFEWRLDRLSGKEDKPVISWKPVPVPPQDFNN